MKKFIICVLLIKLLIVSIVSSAPQTSTPSSPTVSPSPSQALTAAGWQSTATQIITMFSSVLNNFFSFMPNLMSMITSNASSAVPSNQPGLPALPSLGLSSLNPAMPPMPEALPNSFGIPLSDKTEVEKIDPLVKGRDVELLDNDVLDINDTL